MKKIVLLACMALFSEGAMAFEAGQLSLDTPNVLNQGEGSFGIRHRFYGKADDYEKFLGSDDGGNMHFILKYAIMDLCEKANEQSVRYLSMRMTPLNFTRGTLNEDDVWQAIYDGYHDWQNENKDKNNKLYLTIIIALKRDYGKERFKENIQFGIKHKIKNNKDINRM